MSELAVWCVSVRRHKSSSRSEISPEMAVNLDRTEFALSSPNDKSRSDGLTLSVNRETSSSVCLPTGSRDPPGTIIGEMSRDPRSLAGSHRLCLNRILRVGLAGRRSHRLNEHSCSRSYDVIKMDDRCDICQDHYEVNVLK